MFQIASVISSYQCRTVSSENFNHELFFGSELKRSVDEAELLIPNSKVGPDSDNTSCAWIFCRDWFCCLVVYFLCFLPVST